MLSAEVKAPSSDALLELGLPLVRRVAFRMARRLPANVDVGDLIGAGSEGLMKAVASYDPARYPRFEQFAQLHIRSSINDELRRLDVMTRHGRRRMREIGAAVRELEAELVRPPEEQEVADALGVELEVYQRQCGELARGPALARLGAVEPDEVESAHGDPSALVAEAELQAHLAVAITRLPDRMQLVLSLYYQEECTQAEIGQILGVTESRVCQILGECATRLRAILEEPAGERSSGVYPTVKKRRSACRTASTRR